jgi:hypothetical protein
MSARDGGDIALSGETANRLAKRLAGREAARLSLVPGEKKVQPARTGKGALPRKLAQPPHRTRGTWYVLKAKRGDDAQMEKVLQAAAEAARRGGTSHALELLASPGARPHASMVAEAPAGSTDYRSHEARRWAEARATFLVEHENVTAPELARLTGSQSINPSARAHSWVKANRIFSVNDGTGERYPLFQLREGQPLPQLAEILPLLKRKLTNWQIALWFTSPNAWVGGWRRPIDVLTESPDVVIEAARHEVGEHVL